MKKDTENRGQITARADETQITGFKDLFTLVKENYLLFIVFAILSFAIYGNVIKGQFLNLDDMAGFVTNPTTKNISLALKNYDLASLYKAVIANIFGVNAAAYHVFSIIFHIINSILVFVLAYILFGKKPALITTFLFITNPVNSEAVCWLSGYPYLIRAFVILNILIYYSLFRRGRKLIYLIISGVIFLVSMITFSGGGWMFITPFLLVLIDQYVFEKKIQFKNIKYYIPIIIISLIFAATFVPTFFKQRITDLTTLYYVKTETETPLFNRIPYSIFMAYKLMAFPNELVIYHEGKILTGPMYAFMIVITMAIVSGIFIMIKKNRPVGGLMAAIIFSILPCFAPSIIAWTAAERYLYVSSVFFLMGVALLLLSAEEKFKIKKLAFYTTCLLVLLYSIRSVVRTEDYKSSKNMWLASRKTAPYSYRVYNNLGDVYADEGKFDLALENFKRSWALKPDYADAVHNIGYVYWQMRDSVNAKKYLNLAIKMNPRLYQSYSTLGSIAATEGDFESAIQYVTTCLSIDPTNETCRSGLNRLIKEPK